MKWLSRLFRRESPFVPRNHLERLLVQASSDPAARPPFLRALLDSEICVIGMLGDEPPEEEERYLVSEGETVRIQHMELEGRQVLPVFTSPERVAVYAPGSSYIGMITRSLLEITGPLEMLMNPGSAYGKHFLADETRALLDGSMFQPHDTWVAEKAEKFLIGTPARYPDRFVAALQKLFASRREVRRAYLALIHIPSRSESPNLYLAIETDGDLQSIAGDCGIIAGDTLDAGEVTDIGGTLIAPDYFAKDTPIYSRD